MNGNDILCLKMYFLYNATENKHLVNKKRSILCNVTSEGNDRGQRFFLQVFSRFSHTVAGIFAHSSRGQRCFGAVVVQHRLSNPSTGFPFFLRSGDWLSHSRTCFLCSHSFVARVLFRIIVMLKDPARFHLQCSTDVRRFYTQNVTIHGSIHPLLNTISRLVPFA